tara:strand:+ start:413 stop:2224 length:1812 start_codon:yes stop_codon:yes gene_type:complete
MAKKKTTNPTNLMAYDFLPNMSAGDNTGLYGQLAQLGRVQRAQPLVDQRITQAFLDPITTYINKAEEQVVASMVEYNDANPDLDDSLLFDGTEEAIGGQLQENSNRFKELNRKLAYMSPNNKNYADTVSEINKINKENVSLRDQNKKLLDIRNVIKASDISKISTGNGAAYKSMYTDIQQGVKDNFSIKDGKIIWTNPDKEGRVKEISVDSLNAEGPEMTGGAWLELHTKNLNTIGELPANLTASRSALVVKNTFKSLGNSGVKSLLWDNQNGGEKMNSDLTFYNTEPFIQQYIREAGKGVTPDIIEELKVKGMTYTLPGAKENIGDAFSKWYQGKLNEEPKFGKGLPPEKEKESTLTETGKYGGFLYGRNETSGDPNHPDPSKRAGYQNIGYLKQMQNRNILINFDPNDPSTSRIPGLHYDYNYDKDKGWQAFNDGEFVKNVKGSEIARIEGLLSANDIKQGNSYAMFNVSKVLKDQETKAEEERVAPTVPGTVGLGDIEVKGKTANAQYQEVRDNLFNIFNDQFREEFDILPITTTTGFGGSVFGTGSTTSTVRNKIKIRSKDGSFEKIYDVGENATRDIADQITQDFNGYIVPDPLNPNL